MSWSHCSFLCFAALATAKQCDITAYGAKESATENSGSIQKAIADCLSGGEVVIPSGIFRTFPVEISGASDFTMTLSSGAALQALPRKNWPIKSSAYVDFLQFNECTRCTLKGQGMLDGQGTQWYIDFDKGKISADRPRFLVFEGGSHIKVLDVTLLNAPQFNIKLSNVAGAEIGGINITSHWYDDETKEPHNTDGIDPGSDSHDIWIHDVYVYNGDDGVAIKPGTEAGGCTRNILVENSHFERGHGLSIGSVGKGCVKDVTFRNIKLSGKNTENGCRIKTYSNEPGFVRNITWDTIDMSDTSDCITVNAEYKPTPAGAKNFIKVSDIKLKNIKSTSCKTDAEFNCPSQEPCIDIVLDDVQVSGGNGMSCKNAFGTATKSIKSCLKSPSPSPSPSPAPSPTPSPSPSGCDVSACFTRCEDKYGGKVDDGKSGDAYFCAKGCAGMSSGKVSDKDKYCQYDPAKRSKECQKSCDGSSSDASKVSMCKYGCGFWASAEAIV